MHPVGPYDIVEELGRGGMGVVYRARRHGAAHDVALKVIAAGADASAEQLARFQREARIATELDHPGIVKVLETGQDGDTTWFAMELVEGEPLSTQIREREFTWQQAVTIVRDVADALSVAHDKGVLHRDIKPSNILMQTKTGTGQTLACPRARLTDFGLAKDTRTESKYTRTGQTLGTPAYMSPEQARGDLAQLTPASDVWALGCVLYELLSNRPAFEGDTPAAVIGAILTQSPPEAPGVPSAVARLLSASLSPHAANRVPDATQLRAECERTLRGKPLLWGRGRQRRRRAIVIGLTGALLLAAGGIAWSLRARAARTHWDRVAARAWDSRQIDAAKAATELAVAVDGSGDPLGWRLRWGMLHWASGDLAAAQSVWAALPPESAEGWRSRWYGALAELAHGVEGDRMVSRAEITRTFEELSNATTADARLARAASLLISDRPQALALAPDDRWEAALVRSFARDRESPEGAAAVVTDLASVLKSGLPFAWAHHNRGFALARLGRLAEADEEYSRAIALRPGYPSAYLNRAAVRFGQQRDDEALHDLDAVRPTDPLRAQALNGRGRHFLQRRQFTAALQELDRALAIAPNLPEALQNRAAVHHRLGNDAAQRRDLEHLVRVAPDSVPALLAYADLQMDAGATADVARLIGEIRRLAPDHGRVVLLEGMLALRAGDTQTALDRFDVAVARLPGALDPLVQRAQLREQLGLLAGAIDDLRLVLEIVPQRVQFRVNLAASLDRLGRRQEAVAELDRAIELDPAHAEARIGRGKIRLDAGDLDGALAEFETGIAHNPEYARLYYNRSVIRFARSDVAGAGSDLDRALELAPDFVEALTNRGSLRRQLGNPAGALPDLELALKLRPDHYEARINRGMASEVMGDLKRATDDYALAIAQAPQRPLAYLARGLLRLAQRAPGAVEDLQVVVAATPDDAVAWSGLGMAAGITGDYPLSIRALRRALELNPNHPAVPTVRAALAESERRLAEQGR